MDLIERQVAIDAFYKHPNIDWTTLDVLAKINALPSAQPERLTDDDFETIRIHLNAYKEKLCNQQRWKEADEYQRIIDRFMAFASAQPEKRTEERTETHACDLIDRQAAIEALVKAIREDPYYDSNEAINGLGVCDVRVILNDLPSAQPEMIREIRKWINSGNRGNADYFIVEKIEEIINKYE